MKLEKKLNPIDLQIMHTDTVFKESDEDLRVWEIGATDSSKISRALSPEPTVRANNPKATTW